MKHVLTDARRALEGAAAAPLPEMLRRLVGERPGVHAQTGRILTELTKRPDLFRVIDPWRGPWRPLLYPGTRSSRPVEERLHRFGIGGGPWVVGPTDAHEPDQHLAVRRLRESLAHLGHVADTDSFVCATRLARLFRAGDETAARLSRAMR
jgi:hypothetical protein